MSSQLRERRRPRMVHITVKRAFVRDCAGSGVSPTQTTDVELVRVAMPCTTEQCFRSRFRVNRCPARGGFFFVFS